MDQSIVERTFKQSTILVVDDCSQSLRVLSQHLRRWGVGRVLIAKNGDQALKILARSDVIVHLVLLDVMLPGLDGFQVAEILRNDPDYARHRRLRILFITALAETADILRGFEAGGADYITKPFQAEEAKARIAAHLTQVMLIEHLEDLVAERTDRLRQLDAMESEFIDAVAQELRTPMSEINAGLDMLNSLRDQLPEMVDPVLPPMLSAADRMHTIIDGMMDVTRLDHGEHHLGLSRVGLRHLVQTTSTT